MVKDENLDDNAVRLGVIFRERMRHLTSPEVTAVRGKGLLNAIDIKPFGAGKPT